MTNDLNIKLADGSAENMGEGVFVVLQKSDRGPQSVVLTVEDLRRLLGTSEC